MELVRALDGGLSTYALLHWARTGLPGTHRMAADSGQSQSNALALRPPSSACTPDSPEHVSWHCIGMVLRPAVPVNMQLPLPAAVAAYPQIHGCRHCAQLLHAAHVTALSEPICRELVWEVTVPQPGTYTFYVQPTVQLDKQDQPMMLPSSYGNVGRYQLRATWQAEPQGGRAQPTAEHGGGHVGSV